VEIQAEGSWHEGPWRPFVTTKVASFIYNHVSLYTCEKVAEDGVFGVLYSGAFPPQPARRKDTSIAEDLGILLRWHWKYDTACYPNERQRAQMSLLVLFSAFTGSLPGTILAGEDGPSDEFTYYQIWELLSLVKDGSTDSSAARITGSTLTDDCDGESLVDGGRECPRRITRPDTICYGDIELRLLRNPNNPERPIAHILSLVFADDAFDSARLTVEYACKLKMPGRLHALPFEKSILEKPNLPAHPPDRIWRPYPSHPAHVIPGG